MTANGNKNMSVNGNVHGHPSEHLNKTPIGIPQLHLPTLGPNSLTKPFLVKRAWDLKAGASEENVSTNENGNVNKFKHKRTRN